MVILRHVLRNALLPTITVIAAQSSYMIGGLVVVETLFRYQGIGSLILTAARGKDFPMLEAGILTVGAIIVIATLAADMLAASLDPRLRGEAEDEQPADLVAGTGPARPRLPGRDGHRGILGVCGACSAGWWCRTTHITPIC